MFKLKAKIKQAQATLDELQLQINAKQRDLSSMETWALNRQANIDFLQVKIDELTNTQNGLIEASEIGVEYTPFGTNSTDIEKEINKVQRNIAYLLGQDKVVIVTREYRIDKSEARGRQFQKAYVDNLLIGFNAYCDNKEKSVTTGNFEHTVNLIDSAFDRYNKKASLLGVSVNEEYKNCRLSLLGLKLDLKLAKAEEREKIRENKRRLREQELLLVEAEKERKRLEDEKKNLQKLFAQAITDKEQSIITQKLSEVDKRIEQVDWRVSHSSAGWLYIATTKSMPGIYKAGCTKRLNPFNRLSELSSASVPFVFECQGLVFSEDIFALESQLHQRLNDFRVNKENTRKEFFFGEPKEAIKILQDEFGVEVKFVDEDWFNE